MNGKKKTMILIGLFAILMIGASILYNALSKNYKMDSLVTENQTNISQTNTNTLNNSSEESDNTDSASEDNNTDNSSNDNNNSDTDDSSKNNNNSNTDNSSNDNNNSNTDNSSNDNKMTAPDFTVYDLDGNPVNLSDYFGKPIILNFWASWCGPCKMEMPDFNTAYAAYQNEIQFLMINMTDGSRETLETASSFIEENGYSFPVFYDTDYNAAITYSATSLPTTYFIDAAGNLTAHAKGAIDADTLQRGIDMIYKNLLQNEQ